MSEGFDSSAAVAAFEGARLSVPIALIGLIGLESAAFLQQAAFLSSLKSRNGGHGWFNLPAEGDADPMSSNIFSRLGSWKASLGINRDSLRKVRTQLKKLKVLEEKKLVGNRLTYRVNNDVYIKLMSEAGSQVINSYNSNNSECENTQSSLQGSRIPVCDISHSSLRDSSILECEDQADQYRELQKVTNKDHKKTKQKKSELDFSSWPAKPSQQILNDWLAVRKAKRAPLTQTAVNRLASELQQAAQQGFSVDYCIGLSVERGWAGFKFEWLANSGLLSQPQAQAQGDWASNVFDEEDPLQ